MIGQRRVSFLHWALAFALGVVGSATASQAAVARFQPSAPAGSASKLQLISTFNVQLLDLDVTGLGDAADVLLEERLQRAFAARLGGTTTDEAAILTVGGHTAAGIRLGLQKTDEAETPRREDVLFLPAPAPLTPMLPGSTAHPLFNSAYGLPLWAGEREARSGSWRAQALLQQILLSDEFFSSARKNVELRALPWTGELEYQGQNTQGEHLFRSSFAAESADLSESKQLGLRVQQLGAVGQQLYQKNGLPKSAFYFGSGEIILTAQQNNAHLKARFALRWTSALREAP